MAGVAHLWKGEVVSDRERSSVSGVGRQWQG